MRPLYHSRPRYANDHGHSGQAKPGILFRRIELRRTRSDNDGEYLAILVRDPLTEYDIACIGRFLAEIDPTDSWHHRAAIHG